MSKQERFGLPAKPTRLGPIKRGIAKMREKKPVSYVKFLLDVR